MPDWTYDGLIAHFPFDGDLDDYSQNGNNILAQTRNFSEDRFGFRSGAVKIEGNPLILPHPLAGQNNGPKTYAAWVKLNATAENHQVLFSEGGDSTRDGWRIFSRKQIIIIIFIQSGQRVLPAFQIMHMLVNIQRLVCRCLAKASLPNYGSCCRFRIAKWILKCLYKYVISFL